MIGECKGAVQASRHASCASNAPAALSPAARAPRFARAARHRSPLLCPASDQSAASSEEAASSMQAKPEPRVVKVAATQMNCTWEIEENLKKAEGLVRAAAAEGANIILLQELFEAPYFCQEQKAEYYRLAQPVDDSPLIKRFAKLAGELGVVLPISFFERAGNAHFNALVVADADGSIVGHYRKSHIPDGPGYQEKFYFSPGDTGFKVFKTRFADIGVLICWDQWFPEGARCAALMGAELLFYPTAIGSEPPNPKYSSYPHWARVMQGHAGANMVPVIASNRIGTEEFKDSHITFYGGSFITGPSGEIVAQAGSRGKQQNGGIDPEPEQKEGFVTASFDLDAIRYERAGWGLFRDRRPDLYTSIATLDGYTSRML